MATKRKTPASTSTADSARMLLAKAVSQIAADQAKFSAAVEFYQGIGADAVADLQRTIDVKQAEYDETCEQHDHDLKRRKIDVGLELQEHKHEAARGLLEDFGEVPIVEETLKALRAALETTKKELEEFRAAAAEALAKALDDLSKKLKGEAHAAISAALKSKELEHVAKTAQLEAQAQQASKEVTALKSTIHDQRDEIKEQRKLTQSVAEASKQGAIQQSFGGKM